MKKTICLILALLTLAGLIVSCSGAATQSPKEETTAAVTQTVPDNETKTDAVESQTSEMQTTVAQTTEEPTAGEEDDGVDAPDFSVTLTNGETFTLSDHKDKVVLLNLWATWCPPCVGELPVFEKLKNENIDGLEIIALNYAEQKATVDRFIQKNGYTFNVGYDEKGKVCALYPTAGIPYTLIIKNGKIVKSFLGVPADPYGEYKRAVTECFK